MYSSSYLGYKTRAYSLCMSDICLHALPYPGHFLRCPFYCPLIKISPRSRSQSCLHSCYKLSDTRKFPESLKLNSARRLRANGSQVVVPSDGAEGEEIVDLKQHELETEKVEMQERQRPP